MTLRPIDSWDALDAATDHDPLVTFEIPRDFAGPGWGLGAAVAILRVTHTGRRGLTFLGPDDDALHLLVRLRDEGHLGGATAVSVAQSAYGRACALLPLGAGNDWEWMWTEQPPPHVGGEEGVVALDESDRPAIQALLDTANARTDARPFQTPGQRWVGVRDRDRLVAIGCAEPNRSDRPVLTGITVDPSARGTGLGVAVTAVLTRGAVAEVGVCTLGMYSDNAVARRLYLGLGFRIGHRFSSRRLTD